LAKEGFYFVVPVALVSLGFFLAGCLVISALLALVVLALAFFFRDPERVPPETEGVLLSPADGKVMAVEKNGEGWRISVFMSPLDVHVNRSPCGGKVESVKHRGGGHLPAYRKGSEQNERVEILIGSPPWVFKVVLIAGIMARRIKPYVKEGQEVKPGQRIGVILLGSRADLYFPGEFSPAVEEGEKVKAGLSVVARRKNENQKEKEAREKPQ